MSEQILVQICGGADCRGRRSLELLAEVERLYKDCHAVRVIDTGCQHYCEDGPVAVIGGETIVRATADTVAAAVNALLAGKADRDSLK
ncbi:MAG: (2Fe-2S) ferredoxin domain-containing protein [Chloroflexota bacterium]